MTPAAPGSASPADPGADPWASLRRHTSARIALGRAGGSQRTASLLAFRAAHARARDAVHAEFDPHALAQNLQRAGIAATFPLATRATDRSGYLLRPDLGRTLDENSRAALQREAPVWGPRDLAVIISDGLSATATLRHAAATLAVLLPLLTDAGWTFHPIFIAPFARVKLQDEIGELLAARHTLMLLGERPGLGAPDSLGAYFTHRPRAACTDADRNCVSNIRPEGLPPPAAARKLAALLLASARLGISGVALKEVPPAPGLPTGKVTR